MNTVSSRFQVLFKHCTILCTIGHLPVILMFVLMLQKSRKTSLLAEGLFFNLLVLGIDMCFLLCFIVP
jgi:hypothetical protein